MARRKVLIISHDLIGEQMAGPAIRCWELAKELSQVCEVTVTSKLPVERQHPDFAVRSFNRSNAELLAQAREADVLLIQGWVLRLCPELADLGKYLVVDLYDPFIFEHYPHFETMGPRRDETFLDFVGVLDEQMLLGDYFICANERQRDMWFGRFCSLGRLTPDLFAQDPSMKRLIGLVPFGLPAEAPMASKRVLRGVVPGIEPDDFILLWGGGVWNWFDPLTAIRAVAELGKQRSDIKLYFMGVKHPNPEIPEMAMTTKAVELARELGVLDRHVFFNHGWVSYDERQAYLSEVDAGVSSHFDSVETRFSFRTRVLDYLWAGLPILTTVGDGMAELVDRERLGEVMAYEDVEGWKRAILKLAENRDYAAAVRARVLEAAPRFRWSEAAKPLLAYCEHPYRTPSSLKNLDRTAAEVHVPSGRNSLLDKGMKVLRYEGPLPLVKKSLKYLKRNVIGSQ